MGNKLCKRRGNDGDPVEVKDNAIDRIMSRLCLRPNSWTSDLHRSKQVSRSSKSMLCKDDKSVESITKSSDWIDASLEVPDKEISMSFENSKLEPIFNVSAAGTPIPPPRKPKKGIKEKIEAAAKSGLLALQAKKSIEEPLCIKKKIDYSCPCHDPKHKHNMIHHRAVEEKNIVNKKEQKSNKSKKTEREKESKRRKNLSVVSLPNYSDLKLTISNFDDIDGSTSDETQIKSSNVSLPQGAKVSGARSYMVRCRSFGSLLPQQLLVKLKPAPSIEPSAESDDSFGALEDWDLKLIEHYNPRDASLPRPRRPVPKMEKRVLSDLENQIMNDDSENLGESPKKSPTNSTETLLVSDSPTLKVSNPTTTAPYFEPGSLEIYDSIEDYGKNSRVSYEPETTEMKNQNQSSSSINIPSEDIPEGTKTMQNIIQRFLDSEKMNKNTS